ncbi:MAG: hypothetical protein JNJ47_08245 [Alphaproteobacteria bacterium]|nr:hypothetical protein [Alphaproteobacteria bacterium]
MVLEELLSFKSVSQQYPYGDLLQKIEDLKGDHLNLEFIHDILEGQGENIDNIYSTFRKELNEIKKGKKDVFDELKPFFLKPEYSYAKILFPYNITQFHWLTGEIRFHRREGDQYEIEVYAHDPYGGGQIEATIHKELQAVVKKRIQECHNIC